MGFLSRRRGRVATIREMSRFSEVEREQGMDMLQAAEDVFVDLGAPSRLGTTLVTLAAAGLGVEEGSPMYGVVAGVSLMGYSCRMTHRGREIPDGAADPIEAQLTFGHSGWLDYNALSEAPDRLRGICELTAALADDHDAIADLAGTAPGAWQAFVTAATYQLRRNLVDNGLPKRALPTPETIDNLLRLGYAIGVVDEIAGEQAVRKSEIGLSERAPPITPEQADG